MPPPELPFDLDKTYKFYGANLNCFKLDSKIYEAKEDEDDGYRSYLGTVEVLEDKKDGTGPRFFRTAIDEVNVVALAERSGFDGYVVVSTKDGHEWLRFGTDYSDGYYPWFVFEYTPRE